jgi:hypothetical protein
VIGSLTAIRYAAAVRRAVPEVSPNQPRRSKSQDPLSFYFEALWEEIRGMKLFLDLIIECEEVDCGKKQ